MKLAVHRDGTTETVDVDLELGAYTRAERERVRDVLGPDRTKALMAAVANGTGDALNANTLRVLIWAKVVTRIPWVTIDQFTLDIMSKPDMEIPMEVMSG